METYKHIFKETGYLYSVFGGMVENIDNLNNYKILLSIRDPRDILVSSYYSIAYSHKVPPDTSGGKQKKFLDKREWVNSVNIDTYVLDQADAFYSIFNKYKTQLCNQHQVGILKYEDMVTNYEEWLMAIAKLTDMEIPDSIKHELIRNNRASTPLKENKFSHNRKGISGDYKEKLTAETIKELNTIFKPILSYFDYKNEEM